jgi:ABC-type sugar transport system, periplasmic component
MFVKQKVLKNIGLLLVMFLIFSLAACGTSKNDSGTQSESKQTSAQTSPASTEAKDLPEYQILMLSPDAPSNVQLSTDTKIGKIIKDKFNIVFKFEAYKGAWDEKCSLMLAANDYPDILRLTSGSMISKYTDAKAAIALDELIGKYGKNFAERNKDVIPYWRMLSADGKIYHYEFMAPNCQCATVPKYDLSVRSDALEALGYPELLSEESYFEFLKSAMAKFPETNGQKTLGVTLPGAESWGIGGIVNMMWEKGKYAISNKSAIWDNENQKFIDFMLNPYVKQSLQFLNKLYRNDLLDLESFTDLAQQTTDKALKGRPLAVWYATWFTSSANAEFKKNGNEKMQYVTMPIMLQSQIDEKANRVTRLIDSDLWSSMIITKNAKYPERIMQLLDWVALEENQILIGWGIEGEDYNIVDGKRVFTDEFKKKILEQPDELAKEGVGWGYFESLGLSSGFDKNDQCYMYQNDTSYQDLSLTDRQREVYKHYGWESCTDPWYKNKSFQNTLLHTGIIPFSVIPTDSDEGKLEEKMAQLRIKTTPNLIMAKSEEDFEAKWQALVKDYNSLNPEKVIDKYNQIYKENSSKLESLKSK